MESFTIPAVSQAYGDFLRSDHYIFWVYGYNAIFITDTGTGTQGTNSLFPALMLPLAVLWNLL